MHKMFTIAGTSTLNGTNTFRFATGKINVRTAKLKRHGHTEVNLVQLPEAMNKDDAVAWLVSQGRTAVIPTNRRDKPVELTDEQKAAADAAAKKAEFVARMAAARAAKKAAAVAAQDANFLAAMTGEAQVPVPEVDDEPVAEVPTSNADAEGVEALLAALEENETAQG